MCLEALGVELYTLPRMKHHEAISKYGLDRPDLRYALELMDITSIAADVDFKVFSQVVRNGGVVKGINAKGCGDYSRKDIDDLTEYIKQFGAKGLAWMVVSNEGVKSPISKFFSENEISLILDKMKGEVGDLLLFVADKSPVTAESLGNLRRRLAEQMNLIPHDELKFTWVTEFPLVNYNEEEGHGIRAPPIHITQPKI